MKLSKKEELVALGSALYLMGLEMEGSKTQLQRLVELHEKKGEFSGHTGAPGLYQCLRERKT